MQGKLIVDTPSDFDAWLAQMKGEKVAAAAGSAELAKGDATAGKTTFESKCSACHSVGPFTQKIVGPGLGHFIDDSAHPDLVNGSTPTPENIAGILKNGYQGDIGVMPSAQVNAISDQDIANLVAYLVSERSQVERWHLSPPPQPTRRRATHIHPEPTSFIRKYVFSIDAKVIGIQYMVTGMLFFMIAGLARGARSACSSLIPNATVHEPRHYNAVYRSTAARWCGWSSSR